MSNIDFYSRLYVDDTLYQVYDLLKLDKIDKAIDVVFKEIDRNCREGAFDVCDLFLERVDLNQLEENLIVGFLSITFSAKHLLKNYASFFNRCNIRLRDFMPDERVNSLLKDRF